MKRTQIPIPLQIQVLIRLALAVCSLVVGSLLLALFSLPIAAPFFLLALVTAASGGHLYWVAVCGHYLILTGTVLNVERTAVLRRPKAILMEVEGTALRVILRNRHKVPGEGSQLSFYVQDSTPIYEWRGMHLLGTYLAAAVGTAGKCA